MGFSIYPMKRFYKKITNAAVAALSEHFVTGGLSYIVLRKLLD